MQETIDRLNTTEHRESRPDEKRPHNSTPVDEVAPELARMDGGNPDPVQHPKATAARPSPVADDRPNARAARNSNPKSSTAKLEGVSEAPLSTWRLILGVFFPFSAGYYLSFLFRTINASISPVLASDFGLGAAETGLLASAYFLVFAAAQIPIGVLLDRYGPKRVQSVLLVLAVGGASLFGNADSFAELLIGRAMIGLGVAASLMAGLKAIVVWFPRDRVAFVNGGVIMLGSLGAVTATAPMDWLLNWIGWRSLFEVLIILTLTVAGLVYFAVPDHGRDSERPATAEKPLTLRSVFSDPRFLRIAPLSATCIGSSWAMYSLWAGSWLADVERLDRQSVINQLLTMAIGISIGALLLGTLADRLRKRGIATEVLLAVFGALFMLAELAIVLRLPIPSILPWSIVSVMGAATVLSYAIIADYFPLGIAARANGALNLLHFGMAFAAQYAVGLIVSNWSPQDGHYPVIAYQTAFGLCLALQAAALVWFVVPWLVSFFRWLNSLSASPDSEITASVPPAAEGLMLEGSQGIEW
jgi:predicted MFS family arabinose efflux permease